MFLSSSRRIGAGREVCCGVGRWAEVSVWAGWDVSVWTRGYDTVGASGSVGAGRMVKQRAHGRARDRGGGGARHWATDCGRGLHCHLLGLENKKDDTVFIPQQEHRNEQTDADPDGRFTMTMACWFTMARCCWALTACWASGGETQ